MNKNIYYNYTQVSSMLDESDITLKWWIKELDEYLNIPNNNNGDKIFRDEDIYNLKNVKKLIRDDNYTLTQVKNHYSNSEKNINVLDINNQQQIELFKNILINEMDLKINLFKTDLLNQQKEMFLRLLDSQIKLNDDLVSTVSKVVELKNSELYNEIDVKHKEVLRVSNFNADNIRKTLEKRREANQSWYIKLIKKFK